MFSNAVAFLIAAAAMTLSSLASFAQSDLTTGPASDLRPKPLQLAQTASRGISAAAVGEGDIRERTNAWTVGLAAGLPQGTFLTIAAEIARNLNRSGKLRVLPVVTPGATQNVRDLLYLKGIDIAITNTDVFEHFRTTEPIPNIEKRIHYITSLYVSEVHILARPEINSIEDLADKKVNFHNRGAGSSTSGPIIFSRLGVKVQPVFINNRVAIEKMKTGEISALVNNGGKPVGLFNRFNNDKSNFKFLSVPIEKFTDFYVPSTLTSEDYPTFIKPDESVDTVAVPTVLAVYNWPSSSDRFRRVSRFIDLLFERFEEFKRPGYRRQWKVVNLAASVPGWTRYRPVEQRLRLEAAKRPEAIRIDPTLAREQAVRAAPNNPAVQERLFQQFLEWTKKRANRQ